ncbi:MAG: hypothetical protein ACLPGW_04225 [Roseiarcus sp.]
MARKAVVGREKSLFALPRLNPLISFVSAKEKVCKSLEFPWKKLGEIWKTLG